MSEVQNANDVSAVLDEGYPGPLPPDPAAKGPTLFAASARKQ